MIKAVTFDKPDRVPIDLPEKWGSDILELWGVANQNSKELGAYQWQDEWGCVWEKLPGDKTMGQVKVHPLTDYKLLDGFKFPEYSIPDRYLNIKQLVAGNKDQKFTLAWLDFQLMHRLEYLRGHDNAWTDYLVNPDGLCRLLDILTDKAIEQITRLAEIGGVDGIISADDWGFQDRLMLPPDAFHQFFKPRYQRVYSFARERGMITMLHSCGYITEILDGFKQAGLQVIQMDQQENMGLEKLAEGWGGKLCFYCPVDIQKTLVSGSVQEIRAYARKLIDSFAKYDGGFIAKWYPHPAAVGHDPEKVDAMSEEFIKYGSKIYL